ncbi:hypothetical protein Dimus_025979 [Dionaea muscipula]
MVTLAASFSCSLRYSPPPPPPRQDRPSIVSHPPPPLPRPNTTVSSRRPRTVVLASSSSSSSSFEALNFRGNSTSKKSVLSDLIQEIEPLDVSLIQKDVPPATIDAMKKTISGMLGLLPSNQFQVFIEALWKPLSKLLISSMMTGYTLRNAEYRLCLEKNFGSHEENIEHQKQEALEHDVQKILDDGDVKVQVHGNKAFTGTQEIAKNSSEEFNDQGLGEMTPEARAYILLLQSKIASAKKELDEVKRKNAALQMQQFVGEEKNDLLVYLRSLQPEKVAELSEPTCPQLKETIRSVVHGLLATLSPKMHSKAPPPSDKNAAAGAINAGNEDRAELVENTSLHFQPVISLTRDYLARLLFWSMLLGHYLRGLEYRMELMELLPLSSNPEEEDPAFGREQGGA